eukprot:snap_masked-scaffold_6-processed-gene-16.43-mRNA-1 protein AED:1.00 eAED:1.00 QI:0/-1/0/0/-1/1/1/0/59
MPEGILVGFSWILEQDGDVVHGSSLVVQVLSQGCKYATDMKGKLENRGVFLISVSRGKS